MESIGIGLFVNTGDSRAFIILIESLLILTVVALSSIFLKDWTFLKKGEKMDGYNIAILIGAITLVFGILVLVAHYLNDKHTNESKS